MTTRLVVLILIPATVAGILAGLRVRDGVAEAGVYTRIERLATLSERVSGLVQELEDERDLTVQFLTAARAGQTQTLKDQQAVTDRAAGEVREALGDIGEDYSSLVRAKIGDVRYRLQTLPGMREIAGQNSASAFSTLDIYSQVIVALLDLNDLVAQGSPNAEVAESTRAFAALARAKDNASQERALVASVILSRRFATPADRERLLATRSQQDSQMALFRTTATTAQRQAFEDTVTGPEIGQVEGIYQQVLVRSDASPTLAVGLRPSQAIAWEKAATVRLGQMREVERNMAASIVRHSRELKDDAYVGVGIDAALLLIGLLVAALATGAVARSLVRPLRRLQVGALEVAGTRLPGLVDRLRDPEAAAEGIEVEPIDVDSSDEIGQVARAFDEVHREAVRLAADEAVLRGNINAMFVNLSRRSQSLIERQLKLIEDLEQSERDEEQLGNLFRLDHLATRMRRNNENLLVLGGQDQVRRWNRPVPLIDVVRASLSEVEQYERVQLRVHGDMTVAGPVVNDLVHLLAELVENATVFSADHTRVTVSGQQLSGGGAMLQITDAGVGMSQEELEQANWRLANPPVIDFSAARRMGLFVVGRLAVRHGVRVELRAAQGGGLTAFVVLPDQVIAPAGGGGVGSRGFGVLEEGARSAEYAAMATPPAAGPPPAAPGDYRQGEGTGEFGVPRPRMGGTGPMRTVPGGTGPQPMAGDESGPHGMPPGRRPGGSGRTGPQPIMGGTGPQQQPPYGGTGPQPAFGSNGQYPSPGGTGPVPPLQPLDQGPPEEAPRGLRDPYAMRGRHAPAEPERPEPPMDEPPYEQSYDQPYEQPYDKQYEQPHEFQHGPRQGQPPGDRPLPQRQPGAQHPARGGAAEPPEAGDPNRTAPVPPVAGVPEAQPAVPDPAPPARPGNPWETGPMPMVSPPEHGAPEHGGAANGVAPGAGAGPAPERGLPDRTPAEHDHDRAAPPGVPPRSPIFDAMRSEWFQRRTDQTPIEDPVKGWESPADAGFRAAEAVREPVAGQRTQAGLPKRVPGKNRVPGAVGARPGGQSPPQVPGQQPGAPGAAAPPPAPAPSADTVRNRFASLQRGVSRGRNETRGSEGPGDPSGSGTTGEGSSQGDGENGGTR
ncbi:nitrate- and nitrite sensing domain-containing protein [Spirillospora sp. NPDC029432]|uniref:nitrate- and nitrite sensing domain-containing protein n=1 Tax=Spirillospora sp. NPDC029432 TaxID=3154599 RepID=UPI0034548D04